ncbi:KIN14I [Symbiodinium natans]|uniref:KIN14I protein n=1 Tax=Symbiodinium natans TaxID=878477 RepID=A0A812LWX7_9DINO|nr:KIN14I [Symbiodinium natans]
MQTTSADCLSVFQELQEELEAALAGEAVSILAYGATGSGKTHTVTNFAERAAKRLDEEAEALEKEGLRLDVVVQMVEIYNEQFRDLLVPEVKHAPEPPRLKMPTPTSSATLQGAAQRHISRDSGGMLKSLQAALRSGQAHRATCSTAVHGCSSRSHLVMMLYLLTSDATSGAQRRLGRLSLVDLAGSERIKSSEEKP